MARLSLFLPCAPVSSAVLAMVSSPRRLLLPLFIQSMVAMCTDSKWASDHIVPGRGGFSPSAVRGLLLDHGLTRMGGRCVCRRETGSQLGWLSAAGRSGLRSVAGAAHGLLET